MIRVEHVTKLADFDALNAEWTAAIDRYPQATLYLTHHWLAEIWRALPADRDVRCLVARDPDGIAGMVPLMRVRVQRRGIGVGMLRLLGNDMSTRSDLVLLRRGAEVLQAICSELASLPWSVFDCGRTPADSPALALLQARLPGVFGSLQHRRSYVTPVVDLSQAWDAFLAGKSKHFRGAIKRASRDAADLEVRTYPETENLETAIAAVRSVAAQSWQADAGTSVASDERSWTFYDRTMRRAAATGDLLVALVFSGNTPIAFFIGLKHRGVLYSVKTGYVRSHAERSPGTIATRALIESGIADPELRLLDFDPVSSRGDWKLRWATDTRDVVGHYLFRRSPVGLALSRLYRFKTSLRKQREQAASAEKGAAA